MNTKTVKLKATSANGASAAKQAKAANGKTAGSTAKKKSMYQRWIEKHGVDDSPSARRMLKLWKMVYESHNKPNS